MGVVQTATNQLADGTADDITVTFASNITAGNSVVVCVAGYPYSSSEVTVAPSSGGDSYSLVVNTNSGATLCAYILSSAGGYKSVKVTNTVPADNGAVIWAYEVNKLTAIDKFIDASAGGVSPWSSGTTATTTQANEIAFGVGLVFDTSSSSITGPGSPWTNLTKYNDFAGGGVFNSAISGYNILTTTQTVTYSGTASSSGSDPTQEAQVVTFKYTPALVVNISSAAVSIAAQAITPVIGEGVSISPATLTITVYPIIPPGLVASVTALAGVDATGNHFAAGHSGPITALIPDVNPSVVETWHNASPPSGWSGTLRYKILAETNFAVIDFDLTNTGAASPVTLMTMTSTYWPVTAWERPALAIGTSAPTSQGPNLSISTTGVVKAQGWTGNATRIAGTVIYPLD